MIYSLRKPWRKLREKGVKVQMFLPPRLWPPMFAVNLRTHRKVLACDGTVAFTGGMNIGDHHLVTLPRRGRVQDIHFRCTGPVAARLQEAFLMDWAFVSKLPTPAFAHGAGGEGRVPLPSGVRRPRPQSGRHSSAFCAA